MRLEELIGNTPLVELRRICPNPKVRLFGKLEGTNPASSVKDRTARWLIQGAEEKGRLKPGVTLIEPTSGNTGIALAMLAAAKGYKLTLVMPEDATTERIKTLKAFGANLVLTPAKASMEGAIDYTRARVAEGGYLMLDQFGNPDNWRAHYESTGPEIWRDTGGSITHFVSAMGTTGTVMGVSRYLKEQNPDVVVVGVQPTAAADIPGIRRWKPEYLPKIFDAKRLDRTMDVSQLEAEEMTRDLARQEGVFCGVSSGGAAAVGCRLAAEIDHGVIVCVICDRGDRYLSSELFGR
ncbi:MAG: cysteine synthase CysM [Deltaproteobacteria bacterium]|nr:cysteine synthase CysM [Deltaproteobacteria bacterium]